MQCTLKRRWQQCSALHSPWLTASRGPLLVLLGCLLCRLWVHEHGDKSRQLQAVQEAQQQAEGRVAELSTRLEQEQQHLELHRNRWGNWLHIVGHAVWHVRAYGLW